MASKFSGLARKTAIVVFFIVGWVFAYGHGYNKGTASQITLEKAVLISKAQFICKMVEK